MGEAKGSVVLRRRSVLAARLIGCAMTATMAMTAVMTVAMAETTGSVSFGLALPPRATAWSPVKCAPALHNDFAGPASACTSMMAFDAGGTDVPAHGLVKLALATVFASPGLDPHDVGRQHAAASYHDTVALYVMPPPGLPQDATLELRPEPYSGLDAPTMPFNHLTAGTHRYDVLVADRLSFSMWESGGTYRIVARSPAGASLGSWEIPTAGTATVLRTCTTRISEIALAEITAELEGLPSDERQSMDRDTGGGPYYPTALQDAAREGDVVLRCMVQADGHVGQCSTLLLLGDAAFETSARDWLQTTHFLLPPQTGTMPRSHVFRIDYRLK